MPSGRLLGPMLTTTSHEVAGHEITETLGLVRGNTVRARNVGRDITQGLRNLAGGELIRTLVTIYR